MFLRRAFAFVLLVAFALAPCLGVCAGWTASAEAKMACCVDKSANEAEMCCASGEGRQNTDSSTSVGVVLPPAEPVALQIASALAPQPRAELVIHSHDVVVDASARHVVFSVFLI